MHFEGVIPEPGGRAPAPGPLRLVQLFVNTIDLEDGPELLADPPALREWLVARGLLDPGVAVRAADHRRAIELREAIRTLVEGSDGPAPVETINAYADRARLQPVLTAEGSARLEPAAAGVDAALGRIVAAIHASIAEDTWPRLKACERHSCRWAFYDHSKNRSGHWCSMGGCGSREKNRRAYRRRTSRGSG